MRSRLVCASEHRPVAMVAAKAVAKAATEVEATVEATTWIWSAPGDSFKGLSVYNSYQVTGKPGRGSQLVPVPPPHAVAGTLRVWSAEHYALPLTYLLK